MRIGGERFDDLRTEANAHAQDGVGKLSEDAVVISAAAAEAFAMMGEGQAGNKNDFGLCGIGRRADFGLRFHHAEGAADQIGGVMNFVKNQIFSLDAR